MEKSVLLISNDQSVTDEKNTLTSFSGSIPHNFLRGNNNWKVALHSFGLHLMLKQTLAPKYENFPSIIQITFNDFQALTSKFKVSDVNKLSISMFESGLKFYIDGKKSYSSKSLVDDFKLQRNLYKRYKTNNSSSVPIKYDVDSDCITFGQFDNDGKDSEERISKLPILEGRGSRTFVFLNKYFKEGLNIRFEEYGLIWNTAYIDDELYYYFFNSKFWKSKDFYPFRSENKNFLIKNPKIIRILSPNIKHSISNSGYNQSLRELTTDDSDNGKYIHREFENFEYFDVLNNLIDSFEVTFADQDNKQLRLGHGLPSWTKLIFKPVMDNEINVRISSEPTELYPDNNLSNFNVELPQSIDFTWKKNPRVALTRISFMNKWRLLKGLSLDFFIYNIEASENQFTYFKCSRGKKGPRNCNQIVNWFKNKCKEAGTPARLARQANGNNFITFQNKSVLIIGRDLAQCLGFAFAHQTVNNFVKRARNPHQDNSIDVKEDELIIQTCISKYSGIKTGNETDVESFISTGDIIILAEPNSRYLLNYPPRTIELYPNDLYVFCKIVEPTVVFGEFKQLLRIIPLPFDKKNENITIDFPKLEFHEVRELKPRLLQFEITTVDGRYVESFDKEDYLYLNIRFEHE